MLPEFANRIDTAVSVWKAKLKSQLGTSNTQGPVDVQNVAAGLRAAAAELEADLARLLQATTREQGRFAEFEARAMAAIHNGDDDAARDALVAQQASLDTLKELDADSTVVRASLAECRAVLDQMPSAEQPG